MRAPYVGAVVHYVSHGTPIRADGTQAYPSLCRAAIVTELDTARPDRIGACVLNPTGTFYNRDLVRDEDNHEGGTWHMATDHATTPDQPTTYVDHTRQLLTQRHPDLAEEPMLLDHYALLTLTLGMATTRADVHDAWSVWRSRTRPDHRSLVPFDQLTPEVQDLDQPYVDAIHAAAAALGRGSR